jgi:hypothetical protein
MDPECEWRQYTRQRIGEEAVPRRESNDLTRPSSKAQESHCESPNPCFLVLVLVLLVHLPWVPWMTWCTTKDEVGVIATFWVSPVELFCDAIGGEVV